MDGKSERKFMGRNADIMEVKEEAVQEDHQQEQEEQPSSEYEHRMILDQYFGSKGKYIHPSSTSEGKQSLLSENHQRPLASTRTRPKCPVFKAIRKGVRRTRRKPSKVRMVSNNFEVLSSSVLDRAEEIRANLDPQFPNFVKMMLRSHVTKGFWLGLPAGFCNIYMPKHDQEFILQDENGEEYKAKFLADKFGLSAGWKAFTTAHKLLEGDAVIYHLVGTRKFKVYIIRATSLGVLDGALGLLTLENYGSGRKSDDAEGCERSTSFVDLKDFNIIVNGLNLDSQIPVHPWIEYYELCRARKSYLHVGLLESISCTSAAGIISDTVKIANAIKSSNISTSKSDFALWDKTLQGFEILGIHVGFLRSRIGKLSRLAVEIEDTPESERYKQAKLEHKLAEEEIGTLESKLLQVQQARMRINCEMKALKKNIHGHESTYLEAANAPW